MVWKISRIIFRLFTLALQILLGASSSQNKGKGRSESHPEVERALMFLKIKGIPGYSRYPLAYDHPVFDDLTGC